ncbi:uncharacterized protein [Coffea arabica]|uniref:RNase H type-1 domain-containing protein n=1 Tax=Coffea arabica TaxID=13443 RepID=A0ABM4UFB1_COFAR
MDSKPHPFHFINAWADHKEFLGVVKESWQQECDGSPMHVLCSKLQRLKCQLQRWNKNCVGNFSDSVKKAKEEVGRLEKCLKEGGSEVVHSLLQLAQATLRQALAMQESLWRQRSRVKWLVLGDRNTKFFHSVVKQWRMQLVIHQIQQSDGEWVSEDELIGAEAVQYFSDLFSSVDGPSMLDVPAVIPRLVSGEDNEMLEAVPSLEEVRQILYEMDASIAAGPDGFTGGFFSTAWEIVGGDVHMAIQSFFCGAELPRRITTTSIVLIPKVQQPKDFSQYRPISLCNFVNKIFSKILARRLALILPKIILMNQSGFVWGRSISDSYLLAQEIIAGIKRKVLGGNVVFKLDMSKAYDWMMWPFLIQSFRGLQQGDPLSPALFIIRVEVLSRSLKQLVAHRGFQGVWVRRGCPTITHLGYPDDVLIFSGANMTSLKLVMKVLEDYEVLLQFLWGEAKGGQKLHWIRWGDLCLPGDEEGLGFWRLEDIYDAFSIKLWWRFRSLSSFWTIFMKAKFCAEVHPNLVHRDRGSQTWRRMIAVRHIAEQHIGWIGRSNSSNFWFDNWLGNGTLALRLDSVSDHLVADFVNNGTWNAQLIQQWVPAGIAREIAQVDPPVGQLPDLMGPSKYGCCQSPEVEMVDHVFAGGDVASQVWHFFGDTVGVSSRGLSFCVCMAAWWYGKRGNRYLEFVHHVLPLLICWHLWKGRNARKYDGTHIQEDRLCRLVFTDLLELFAFFFPSCRVFPVTWRHFYTKISGWAPRSSFKPVRWVRPLPGGFKLNTDGCSKGNPGISGSGGILRDGGGRFCLAFSCHFGKATSLQAEARALLVGVEMCIQGGFDLFEVELDSLVLVDILLG